MKKALFFLAVLCVAGIFSVKAQSASDSAYARNLNYKVINTNSFPVTVADSLADTNSKFLKDIYSGRRARGFSFSISSTQTMEIHMVSDNRDWDTYLFLLDSNFTPIARNDDYSGGDSKIIKTLAAGRYHILATEYSYWTNHNLFTITLNSVTTTDLNSLTYTPLGTFTDTTINDTFLISSPDVLLANYIYKARGYSFQGTQNKIVSIAGNYSDVAYLLMDNNFKPLRMYWETLNAKLPQTGTYYLAVLYEENSWCETEITMDDLHTYYVDALNGNDSNNGLTPSTALATLDTAISRSNNVGRYYITEDYIFSNSIYLDYAEIYPYQKDIRLSFQNTFYDYDVITIFGSLIFGEEGSNYHFIIDSNRNDSFDDFLDADYFGSYLEVNNLRVTNSLFLEGMFWGDDITLRNCEFTNDSIGDYFIGMAGNFKYSLKLINCNFSQNRFGHGLFDFYYDSLKVYYDSTNFTNNTINNEYAVLFYDDAFVNLKSGSWSNNRLSNSYAYCNDTNITAQNAGGLWLERATVTIGNGFTMDSNNYICLDPTSSVLITENLSANPAATLYPMYWDYDHYAYTPDYYSGRTVLTGDTALLANNFRKFRVAQTDTVVWFIHSDGKLHTDDEPEPPEPPVAINGAEDGTFSLYPNPANKELNIALQGTEVNEVVVIDIYGKTVARTTVANGNNTLNISALPAGMYFVQLRTNNSVKATQKIVKR